MQIHPRTVRKDGPALGALVCAAFLALPMQARADVAVYQSVVPLAGATEADRNAAFGDALRAAAVRASGQLDAGSSPVIASAATQPARYIQQYSTTADHMLKVGFEARAMDRLMQQAGLPFWPLERPVTVVLLVVPTVAGGERAVLASERVPERLEVERAAATYGLPVTWPQQPVAASQVRAMLAGAQGTPAPDAWGGQAVLAGVQTGGTVAWSYSDGGVPARAEGTLRDGAGLAVGTLAARYAPPSSRGTTTIAIRVGGIEDLRAYAALVDYLESLSLVREVGVDGLADRVVSLDVTLRGDLGLLRRIVALGKHLVPVEASGTDGVSAPDFRYVP